MIILFNHLTKGMEMLLTNNNYKAEVECLLKDSRAVNIAVSFWGQGAEALLCSVDKETSRIICNLNMGGTNPNTIRHIRDAGYNIQHADNFHGKVLFSKKTYILGSANFSANGLGLEGDQLANLQELGLKGDEKAVLKDLNVWFDNLWETSKKIKDTDLKALEEMWKKRRDEGLNLSGAWSQLRSSDFQGVKAYACFTCEEENEKAELLDKEVKREEKVRIEETQEREVDEDLFSGWCYYINWPDEDDTRKGQSPDDLPVDSYLIDVVVNKKMTKVVRINSIYKRIPYFDRISGETSIQMVEEVPSFGKVENGTREWKGLLKQLKTSTAEYISTASIEGRGEKAHIIPLSDLLKEIGR